MNTIDTARLSRSKPTACHVLPCKIAYSGPAKVQKYFTPKQSEDGPDQIAYFQGRRLVGSRINMPPGYTGLAVQKSDMSSALGYGIIEEEEEDAGSRPTGIAVEQFKDITVWGHESAPDMKTNEWNLGIAEWAGLAQLMNES